jgi:hypothetical protein
MTVIDRAYGKQPSRSIMSVKDLDQKVRDILTREPALSWDDAVQRLARAS